MNKRIIVIAHLVALTIILLTLVVIVVAAGQSPNPLQQCQRENSRVNPTRPSR